VVDLGSGKAISQIDGLREPQGIGYSPGPDVLAVANAGDGSVRLFKADDLTPAGRVELGDDANNIRTDRAGRLVVGYGGGGLAHPEGFQIDPTRHRIYVNHPTADQIAVIDSSTGKIVAKWGSWLAAGNFPMALDDAGHKLFSDYRWPASVVAIDTASGEILNKVSACGDSDDMFHDGARKRLYVSCGNGRVAILDAASGLSETSTVSTRGGARRWIGCLWPFRCRLISRPKSESLRHCDLRVGALNPRGDRRVLRLQPLPAVAHRSVPYAVVPVNDY
jgi:DNA-binding beta-propeller fold protein YncE